MNNRDIKHWKEKEKLNIAFFFSYLKHIYQNLLSKYVHFLFIVDIAISFSPDEYTHFIFFMSPMLTFKIIIMLLSLFKLWLNKIGRFELYNLALFASNQRNLIVSDFY